MNENTNTATVERTPRMEPVEKAELQAIDGGLFFLALSLIPSGAVGYFGMKAFLNR